MKLSKIKLLRQNEKVANSKNLTKNDKSQGTKLWNKILDTKQRKDVKLYQPKLDLNLIPTAWGKNNELLKKKKVYYSTLFHVDLFLNKEKNVLGDNLNRYFGSQNHLIKTTNG